MSSRTMMLALALISLAVPKAQSASRWDYAFDGGWMRVLLDVDQTLGTVTGKVYQTSPNGNSVLAENLHIVNAGDRYVLYGPITSGTFKVGVGNLQFTVGDQFMLTVFKNGQDVNLVLRNATDSWATSLKWF